MWHDILGTFCVTDDTPVVIYLEQWTLRTRLSPAVIWIFCCFVHVTYHAPVAKLYLEPSYKKAVICTLSVDDSELLLCQTEALFHLSSQASSSTDSDCNQTSIEMKQTVTLFFLLGVFLSRSTTPGKLYLNLIRVHYRILITRWMQDPVGWAWASGTFGGGGGLKRLLSSVSKVKIAHSKKMGFVGQQNVVEAKMAL